MLQRAAAGGKPLQRRKALASDTQREKADVAQRRRVCEFVLLVLRCNTSSSSRVRSGGAASGDMGKSLLGIKVGPTATGTSGGTTKDLMSAGFTSGPLGGTVTAVSMSIVGGLLPGATRANTKAIVAFTPSSPLIQGQLVTIGFPSGYLAGAARVDYTVATTFGAVSAVSAGYTIVVGSIAGGLPAAVVTFTLTGVTLTAVYTSLRNMECVVAR